MGAGGRVERLDIAVTMFDIAPVFDGVNIAFVFSFIV